MVAFLILVWEKLLLQKAAGRLSWSNSFLSSRSRGLLLSVTGGCLWKGNTHAGKLAESLVFQITENAEASSGSSCWLSLLGLNGLTKCNLVCYFPGERCVDASH